MPNRLLPLAPPRAALRRSALLLAAALPTLAAATPQEWRLQGVFDQITGWGGLPPGVAVGQPFELRLQFDTQAPLLGKLLDAVDGDGYRYRFDGSAVHIAISLPGDPNVHTFGNQLPQPVLVRDNFPVLAGSAGSPQVDGYSFTTIETFNDQINGVDVDLSALVVLRGTNLSWLAVQNNALPATPPSNLADLLGNALNLCRYAHDPSGTIDGSCPHGFIGGHFTALSVTSAVPEPGPAASLALGLAVLAWLGRRRGAVNRP